MQNRRMFTDDGRGVAEPLDEMAYGKPIRVTANYKVQLFDRTKENSVQRVE